ncbi:DUF4258 domain-containing protein [Vreelandella boliviensis]|uniref:DUF4258 domain-containing protein n=1 Tax=Vreelandella boliviensis TaxID=223527 RepID=UPI001B8C7C71|nr:DUF4258 domain-containing protein [Halomonas boliviensis]MBS3668075.1 DUF4258 domain-containing protein [Halomonas boliviensis]
MSDDSNTPPACQGQARNGQARHAGNAEARWRALTSYPDFCQVGDKIVGFDSEATLGNPVNYSPNVITAGQRTYRVGDLCQGTEGNAGSGVGSGTSQGSGHVLFLTGQDNVKANGQPVVHDGSECMINCNAAGVGGAKGYVHTNTESVNSQPEESSEPLTEAERFQQEAQANLERLGELREALNNNPNGKTTAEAEALYAGVQQLVSETQAQQEAFNEADRAGLFSRDEMVQSDLWVGQAANSARNMVQQAERQLSRSNARGTWGDVVIGFNPIIGGLQLLEEVGDGIRSGQYGQAMLPVLLDSTPIGRSLGSMVKKVFGGFKKPKRVDRDASSSTNDTSTNQRESGQDNEGLRVEENSSSVGGASPRTPVGRSGQRNRFPNPDNPRPRNAPEVINGREFNGHAIDRMQERGFTPSVVENAIENGVRSAGNKPGSLLFTDAANSLKVVVNSQTGRVITVIPGSK